ncbi:hypothetical protein [Methyloceanibacter sp.]|uniref:hypothetical protein n=1 Tax=Methyloceanibacter sp. TaxID=1965321 RepID=UPI003D6D6883
MLPARQFTAAAALAALLIAGGWFGVPAALAAKHRAEAKAEPPAPTDICQGEAGLAILSSPLAPWKGAPLRVVFTAEKPLEGELSLIAPNGNIAAASGDRHGGPPYFWFAEVASPAAGTWRAMLVRNGASADCKTVTREIVVQRKQPAGPRAGKGVWPLRDSWDRDSENLYSAWIEKLFDAPLDEAPSWKAMHEVLRDPSRNVLYNHLGLREDQQGQIVQPDCADVPYFLRAYFAFKMGLPFGYSKCTRGDGGQPPKCPQWWNIVNEEPPPAPPGGLAPPGQQVGIFGVFAAPVGAPLPPMLRLPPKPQGLVPGFGYYLRTTIANAVHSGNGRTAADDDDTDYYPVPLSEDTLRPGTIYADPYGHVLVLVKRVPQSGDGAGVFLAVDGQPDGTVARKRFWRGNFLFAQDPALGSPGFKRFRPIMREKNGTLRRLANAEIAKSPDYGDFSLDQSKLSVEDFYDRMDDVMSPAPLDPEHALKDAITSLEEQVNTRVASVENGRKYLVGGGREVDMPDGASIFETTGAWEDFATPSRDLRLLIAIDVVRGFPDRVARRPERYAMPKDKSAADVKAELESTLASELAARKFSYTRTDGSEWSLALKDLLGRVTALEMAYNLNDCVELRWGAPEGSEEASTCKRHAPASQRQKMSEYRAWFSERRRPPRG